MYTNIIKLITSVIFYKNRIHFFKLPSYIAYSKNNTV